MPDVDGLFQRPLACGLQISRSGGGIIFAKDFSGTITCFVKLTEDTSPSPRIYLLTAEHVISPNDVKLNDSIVYQPKKGGSETQVGAVGTKKPGADTRSLFSYRNGGFVDARLVPLKSGIAYRNYVWRIGYIKGLGGEGMDATVMKHGAITGYTTGKITSTGINYSVNGIALNLQMLVSYTGGDTKTFCEEGDSGAPVMNGASQLVGMVIRRNDDTTGSGIVTPIETIFAELKCSLAPSEGTAP